MRLSLCCDVLYLFEPAFELPAVVFQFKLDGNEAGVDLVLIQLFLFSCVNHIVLIRGTQRHSENMCSEDDLRSTILVTNR